jgi:mono/diheme cytochrome c family protein
MKSSLKLVRVCLLIAIAASIVAYNWRSDVSQTVALHPSNPAIVQKGRNIYSEHCANCHGSNLEGEANWRQRDKDGYLPAPPHDASGHTWHHSDHQLFELTKFGLGTILGDRTFKTRMPAYEDVLTDAQILAVLSFIKSRWPAELQARHDKINEASQRKSN